MTNRLRIFLGAPVFRLAFGIIATVCVCVATLPIATHSAPVRPRPDLFTTPWDSPATIGIGQPKYRIALTPVEAVFHHNTWPLLTVDQWLDKDIPVNVRRQFIDDIPPGGFMTGTTSEHSLDVGIGGFEVHVALRTVASATVAPDVFEVLLLGNELNRTYSLTDSNIRALAFADASVAYALPLGPSVRIGARYHQIIGAVYAEAFAVGDGQLVYTDDEAGVEGELALHYIHTGPQWAGGRGSALDVGVDIRLSDNVAVGAAVMDIGQIRWPSVTRGTCTWVQATEGNVGCTEATVSGFVRPLPQRWQVAVGWQLFRTLHLGASYTRFVSDVSGDGAAFVCSTCNRFETTLVWTGVKILHLGVGAAYSDSQPVGVAGAVALQLGPMRARARVTDLQTLFGRGDAAAISFGFDVGFAF